MSYYELFCVGTVYYAVVDWILVATVDINGEFKGQEEWSLPPSGQVLERGL